MASSIDICNLALQWCGQPRITSLLTPTNALEELCALNYPLARDACLEEHAWSFALKRVILDPTNIDPVWGDGFTFQIPTDAITVLRVFSIQDHQSNQIPGWRKEGGVIYAKWDEAYAIIISRETNTNLYSPTFVQALAARLAMDIAIPLTDSMQLMTTMREQYAIKLREAVSADGIQGSREIFLAEDLINVRSI